MSVYNGEKYLRESIESILQQSFSDFEFIIINDASTDDSLAIIKEYQRQDQRIVIHEKLQNNGYKGFVENLNLGISQSKGKYIARMDADDISLPDRLDYQYSYLEKNPQVFLVGTSIIRIDENGKKLLVRNYAPRHDQILKNFKKGNSIAHPTILFRNEKNLFYRDKLYACEDYDFYLRMVDEGKILANLDEPLFKYRYLPNSISRDGNSFVKRLFLEKTKAFHLQRKNQKFDAYDALNDEEFFNILDVNSFNKQADLIFAAQTAILYQRLPELKIILDKLYHQHQYENFSFNLSKNKWVMKINSYLKTHPF